MDRESPAKFVVRPKVFALFAAAALAAYGWLIAAHVGACAGGSDSSGYMNHARLLAEGHVRMPARVLAGLGPAPMAPYLYSPLGFIPADNDPTTLIPTYPPGLPLLIVAAVPFAGWNHAADLVLTLHAVAGVLLVFLLGRVFGLPRAWACAGAAIVAVSPLYLFMSVQAMSDVPALVWTTAAVLAAWVARSRTPWAAAAGAALSVAVLIRPTDALALLPVGIALGARPRRWGLLALGAFPAAVFAWMHSRAAYGHLFATGYGDVSTAFMGAYVMPTLMRYGTWLPVLFTPVCLLFLALPMRPSVFGRAGAVLFAWAVVYLAFYSAYEFTHETWWYLRFILPAAPALVIGGLLVLWRVRLAAPQWVGWPALAFVAWLALLANGLSWGRTWDVLGAGAGERAYQTAGQWIATHTAPGAIVGAMQMSGAVSYYTDRTLIRWDMLERGDFARVREAALASGRPIYAALFPFEQREALTERMPGPWTQVAALRDVTVWRFGPTPSMGPATRARTGDPASLR